MKCNIMKNYFIYKIFLEEDNSFVGVGGGGVLEVLFLGMNEVF